MLKVQELQVNYGGIRAVKNISFEVPDGSIVTLVGANGAGKTTTLRTIAGQVKAQAGSITYNGEELLGMPSDEIVPSQEKTGYINKIETRAAIAAQQQQQQPRVL